MTRLPSTEPEIEDFLAAFEGCTLPKVHWTHRAHLLTGACYVHALGEHAAINQMRACVRRYNESVGTQNTESSGYHETITIAWIKLLAGLLRRSQPIQRADFATLAIEHFSPQRDIFKRHYDFDLVSSKEARLQWIEPTLQPLD